MCFMRDPVIKDALPYPIYARKPQITVLSGSQALDLEIMERTERIDRICDKAREMWKHGTDPNWYIETLFLNEGIDIDSLTEAEIDKINHACQ